MDVSTRTAVDFTPRSGGTEMNIHSTVFHPFSIGLGISSCSRRQQNVSLLLEFRRSRLNCLRILL